jgi:hypothetical protein
LPKLPEVSSTQRSQNLLKAILYCFQNQFSDWHINILLLPFVENFVLFFIACNSYLRMPLFRTHLWRIIYRSTGGGSFMAKNMHPPGLPVPPTV